MLTLHVINLFILIIVATLQAVFYLKWHTGKLTLEEFYKFDYYEAVADLVSLNIEFYVDLFLLWLLYRFMKPQNIL